MLQESRAMALLEIKTEPEYKNSVHEICRLCLSEESLEDLFQEADLHQLISDFLSITVSPEDRLSHAICSICRIQLTEFQQFWIRCQEVQGVLQSMVQDGNGEAANDLLADRTNCASENQGCTCCGKTFESRQHLDNHMETHEKSTEANEHQRSFDQSSTWIPLDVLSEVKIEESQVVSSTINSADSGPADQEKEEDRALQFKCKICHKAFRNKSTLSSHKAQAHKPKKFFCPACGVAFFYRKDFNRHNVSKTHLKNINAQTLRRKRIDCKKETKVIDTDHKTENIVDSSATASDQSPPSSEMVDANRETDKNMINSEQISAGGVQTEADKIGFYHSADLRKHELSMVHLIELQNSGSNVEMIAKNLGHDEMLKRIEKRKKEKLECKICNKVFEAAKNLWNHEYRVHRSKKIMCHPCGISFSFKSSLRRHISRKAHLTKLENIRLEVDQSPDSTQCTICRKVFKNKEALKNHKRTVHGPKNITCDICGVGFRYQRDLKRHERSNLHLNKLREGRQHSVLDVADMTEIGDVKVEIRTDEQMPSESGQIIKNDEAPQPFQYKI